jgi:hypothetical protein
LDTSLEQMQHLSQKGRADLQAKLVSRQARREMFAQSGAAGAVHLSRTVFIVASLVGVLDFLSAIG